MNRRLFLAAALCLAAPAPAVLAEPKQLSAAEIETLLSGNTITGVWAGSEYTQYFAPNGVTTYVPKGGRADDGKWRVNAATNMYESWWAQTGWTPYEMARDGDALLWVDPSGATYPFEVHEGKQLP